MRRKLWKTLSFLISLMMLFSSVNITAFAQGITTDGIEEESTFEEESEVSETDSEEVSEMESEENSEVNSEIVSEELEITGPSEEDDGGIIADETPSDWNDKPEENEIEEETTEIVANKTVNGCTWTLDSDGNMVIRDSEGEAGASGNWGFDDYKDQIKSVDMDISKGTHLASIFYKCTKLESAKIKIDQSEGSAESMFSGCSSLTSLDLSGFDTQNVTDMSSMFDNCSSLTSLDLSGLNTKNVTRMYGMFGYCSSLTSLDLSGFDTQNVKDMSWMFSNCKSLTSLDLSGLNMQSVKDMSAMFSYCGNLTSLDLSGLNTKNVTSMNGMFSFCGSLTDLKISGIDTQNVTDMNSMFSYCKSLTSLDLSGLETKNVTNMGDMFSNCKSLESLDLSGLDMKNVTDMSWMFVLCTNLKSLDLSGLETKNLISMAHMFSGCGSLEKLDLSGFDTKNVTSMDSIFSGCSSLRTLDLNGIDTKNVTDMESMFSNCSSLTSLDLSGFDMQNVIYTSFMFDGCSNLKRIKTFKNLSFNLKLPYETMYDKYGIIYNEFPQGLEEGIWLTKEAPELPTFSKENYNVMVGLTYQLTLEKLPEGVDISAFVFSSSDTEILTVDGNGLVTAVSEGTATITTTFEKYKATCTVTVFEEGFFVTEVADVTYTGAAIKPKVLVYDDTKLLTEGVDYTLSYANNILVANKDSKKAPKVIVTGKGNYSGKVEETFNILPYNVEEGDVLVSLSQSVLVANNKVQKTAPVVTFNGKKLTANKDYTVSYPQLAEEGAYKNPGIYDVEVTFKNNFTGSKTVKVEIKEGISITKVKVGTIVKMPYTGTVIEPKPVITMGSKTLVEGTDYSLTYGNNILPGKATVKITGMGEYVGERSVTFEITGIPIGKAQIIGLSDKTYNGKNQSQNLKVSLDNGTTFLTEDVDYKVVYEKNLNVGTAKVKIVGAGGYVGTINKSFRILPYNLSTDVDKAITGIPENLVVSYLKGGCKPTVSVAYNGVVLDQKKECNISYSNNTKLGNAFDTKAPTITIKGKGNFTGTITIPFTIVANDLSAEDTSVKLTVADVAFVNKVGKYISVPVLVDSNGKKLVAGTDYEKTIVYSIDDKVLNPKTDIVVAGSEVKVTVTGKGFYAGTMSATYRITEKSFSSAKIIINKQTYTGKPVELTSEDIKVVVGKDTLLYGVDYEVVEDSYVNNVAKGNAYVTIKGKGKYGGMKTVKFAIISKGFDLKSFLSHF